MNDQLWIGAGASTLIAVVGWTARQLYLSFQGLKRENLILKDEKSSDLKFKFEKSNEDILLKLKNLNESFDKQISRVSEKLQENLMSVTKLQVELSKFSDIFFVIQKLNKDVAVLKSTRGMMKRPSLDEDGDDGANS
jgi:hypothetical protein